MSQLPKQLAAEFVATPPPLAVVAGSGVMGEGFQAEPLQARN